jgi:hypothetical protein
VDGPSERGGPLQICADPVARATRGRVLLNINGIRARLVAYGEKLNRG